MNIPLYYLLQKAAEAQPGGVDPPEDIAAIRLAQALAVLNGSGGADRLPTLRTDNDPTGKPEQGVY